MQLMIESTSNGLHVAPSCYLEFLMKNPIFNNNVVRMRESNPISRGLQSNIILVDELLTSQINIKSVAILSCYEVFCIKRLTSEHHVFSNIHKSYKQSF